MGKDIFRKSSLEKRSSPEQITDYIKTSNASMWMVLSALIIFIIGGIIWGIFGQIETSQTTVTVSENGKAVCYIAESDIQLLNSDTAFEIDGQEYNVHSISELPAPSTDILSPYAMHIAGFNADEWVYTVELTPTLSDGIYQTQMILDRVSPVSLLLN